MMWARFVWLRTVTSTRLLWTVLGYVIRAQFLGAFAKLRKVTISFIVSVRLSARMEQLGPHWTDLMTLGI